MRRLWMFALLLLVAFPLAAQDIVRGPRFGAVLLSAQYPTSDVLCAHAGDTSISGVICNNSVTDDVTTAQAHATTFPVTGGLLAAGKSLRINLAWTAWTSASSPDNHLVIKYGSTIVFDPGPQTSTSSLSNRGFGAVFLLGAVTKTTMVASGIGFVAPTNLSLKTNSLAQPITVTTTDTAQSLTVTHFYAATGLASVVSVTGGSVTGTAGQTCLLNAFNSSCSGSTATATLAGTNTIAGATFVVTTTGAACTGAPTAVTLTSGTATCSGSGLATSTTLGGAQGNAIKLLSMLVELP